MIGKTRSSLSYLPYILIFLISTLVLSLGFYRNQWNAARDKKFSNLDKSSEGFVIGRLVLSRQSGIFSNAGLIGMGDVDPSNIREKDSDYQYDTYLDGSTFDTYFIYRSQIGGQAAVFSLIDAVLPTTPYLSLRLFRGITSLLTALAIGLLITWIYLEFGLFPALVAFLTTVLSQWLTLFGRNIFWGIWLYFVPFLAIAFLLRSEREEKPVNDFKLAAVIFLTLFLKCLLSGYDFISTAAVSASIPIFYYAILRKWNWPRFLKRMFAAVAGASLAVFLSLAILAGQIGSLEGSYREGIRHIVDSVGRRTYGDPGQYPIYAESLQARVSDVIFVYLTGERISRRIPMQFGEVILIFLLFSCVFFMFDFWKNKTIEQRRKVYALVTATWVAFLGSISTYVIFKSASYIHTHLYYIVWHLPFTILGFTMCGYIVKVILQMILAQNTKQIRKPKLN